LTFAEFAARKTREAESAVIPGFSTEFDRGPQGLIRVGNEWSQHLFDGPFYLSPSPGPDLPACSLVFVQSRDGNTGAKDPSTLGGGATDLHLIYEGLSRVAADGVLAGAETVRGGTLMFSVWHPELVNLRHALGKPRHPTQIVATLRGLDVENGLLFNEPTVPVIVLTVPTCAQLMMDAIARRPWVTPIVMSSADALTPAFEQMRTRGIERISAVGGRRLAAQLIDAGLVQDLYLTTSSKDAGEPNTPLYPGKLASDVIVRKQGWGEDAGVVFEHHTALWTAALTAAAPSALRRVSP
jgi:5-amino-6-(5-phosphoribosylamino)uracil reductase